MSSVAVATQTPPQINARSHVDLALVALAFGGLWFALCRHLSGEWSINEQYSYGWFVPVFAAYLFWLRWQDRPEQVRIPDSGNRKGFLAIAVCALLLLLPLRVFEIGNPDWRPLSWFHAVIVAGLSLLYIGAIGGRPWLRHFSFPICFIFVAVPWISAMEEPVVEGLMRMIAATATETLTLFGIPAQVQGNLIRLPNGLVGVNEACSGVRSLQTSLMIGLLFGELKRLSILRRISLVLGAIAIALVANFLRALSLVSIAARDGLNATARWHDIAGYAVVVLVFAGTILLASNLAKSGIKNEERKVENVRPSFLTPHSSLLALTVFAWLVFVEFAAAGWYRAHERNVVRQAGWNVAWPENAPGFHEIKIDEIVRQALRFDSGREVVWQLRQPNESPATQAPFTGLRSTCYLFFFRWNPGISTILRARAHRPDICLPSAGWTQLADHGTRNYAIAPDLTVPFRHFTFAHEPGLGLSPQFAHTFFCLHEDVTRHGEEMPLAVARPGNWSPADRLRVVREGVRNLGQQVLEVVIVSPERLPSDRAEEEFEKIIRGVITTPKS